MMNELKKTLKYFFISAFGLIGVCVLSGNNLPLNQLDHPLIQPVDSMIFAYSLDEALRNPNLVMGLMISDFNNFPEEILGMKRIRKIVFSECGIKEFPTGIGSLPELISLEFIRPEVIPSGISAVKNLKYLRISGCDSLDIPDELLELEFLVGIMVKHCSPTGLEKLSTIRQAALGSMDKTIMEEAICHWNSIEFLYLFATGLDRFPLCLFEKPSIEELWLSDLNIDELPDRFHQLPNLNYLKVSYTNISSLPKTVYRHPGIRRLEVEYNKLSEKNLEDSIIKYQADTILIRQGEFRYKKNWD